jgi:hypothetical protein
MTQGRHSAASGRLKVAPTTPFFSLMDFLQRIKTVVLLSKSIHAIALARRQGQSIKTL